MALVKTLSMGRRPLMLKDYLRDDLSSCSSSGFKSFPRRQCCTTVRFILEFDLKTKDYTHKYYNIKKLLQRSRSKAAASKTISVLQRASGALLNAVKLLPFPSVKSPSSSVQKKSKKGLQPRSLLSKPLKTSFWRKAHEKQEAPIKRGKMFSEYLEGQPQQSDQITRLRVSSSERDSNSWAESDFTADVLQSSSGNSESSSENDIVESKKVFPSSDKKLVGKSAGVSVGEASITNSEENTKDWQSEEEKEQFSPVSVLDYPFQDENDINSPPYRHRLACVKGTKQKHMQFAKLEPIDLEKRIASFENEDVEETQIDEKVQELLKALMNSAATTTTTTSSSSNGSSVTCKADHISLLSDFFREKLAENKAKTDKLDLLKEAEDWINGIQPQELQLGWEVKDGRKSYVVDMENYGKWWSVGEEKQEVGLALELQIFTSLLDELLLTD